MSTNDERPRRRQRGPSAQPPSPSSAAALQDTVLSAEDTSRARRLAVLRGVGAAYHHLKVRGLVSTVVVETLQQCLRDAA